jgi:hypothetical protein
MSMLQTSPTTVSLDIGGLGIDLICNDLSLTGQLARRYRHFPPVAPRRYRAFIQIEPGGVSTSLIQLPLRFRDGVLKYDAPGFQGYVDPAAGHASLTLRSLQPEVELDYYLRTVCALLAFEAGGALFHAAAILRGGRAYAFFGHSGSGKSTVARLSAPDVVLNDDLVLLMPRDGAWQVHATPFWNQFHGQNPAPPAPLAGLFRLVQDQQVYLERMEPAHAAAEMIASLPVVSADRSRGVQLIQRCQAILERVPAYRLHFLPDASFWPLVEGATGARIEPG